jgi:hypothetical protein
MATDFVSFIVFEGEIFSQVPSMGRALHGLATCMPLDVDVVEPLPLVVAEALVLPLVCAPLVCAPLVCAPLVGSAPPEPAVALLGSLEPQARSEAANKISMACMRMTK